MSKMAVTILVVWAMLAGPLLAYWEHDGISVYISEPDDQSDPYGHWRCYWNGSGTVSGGTYTLSASGYTYGGSEVEVWAPDELEVTQVGVYAWSTISGSSDYHWVSDETSKAISWAVDVSLSVSIAYDGDAFNRVGTHSVSASSGANGDGGGAVSPLWYQYGYATGTGSATAPNGGSSGSHSASNDYGDWDDVDVSSDDADSDMGLLESWYEGELIITTSIDTSGGGTPWGTSFSSSASVSGSCGAAASISIDNPNLQGGEGYANAYYYVDGSSDLELDGNIDDRE